MLWNRLIPGQREAGVALPLCVVFCRKEIKTRRASIRGTLSFLEMEDQQRQWEEGWGGQPVLLGEEWGWGGSLVLRGTTSSMWCVGCLIHPLGEGGVQSPANILNRMGRHRFIFRRGKEEGSTNQTLLRCPRFKSVLFFLLPPVCLPCFSKAIWNYSREVRIFQMW